MALRYTKTERATLFMFEPVLINMLSALFRGESKLDQLRIKATAAPRDFLVIDKLIIDAVVMNRCEQLFVNAVDQVALEHQIVIAEGQNIGLVCAFRCSG